jgi:cytochrome P450
MPQATPISPSAVDETCAGTIVDLGAARPDDDPYATHAALAAACPFHRARFTADGTPAPGPLGRPFWLATGYAAAADAMLSDGLTVDPRAALPPEALAELPGMDPEMQPVFRNLLSLDPPDHARLRRLAQPSFTTRAIQPMRPRIRAIAERLLDDADAAASARGERRPNRGMDLIRVFAAPLPIAVIFELLGIPQADRERVYAWTHALLNVGAVTDAEQTKAALRPFIAYTRALVAAKRAEPADDLLSTLVAAEADGDRLDEDELLSMVFLLVLAGHVTTVNLIGNGALALLNHPDQLAMLRADPSLIPAAVEEILRYWGPVEIASERYARAPMDLDGIALAAGDLVIPDLAAANRDPARFADPDRFDITRPDANRHVAFGKGIHACLGAPLARLEGEVALGALLDRCPDLRLAIPAGEARWHSGPLLGLVALPVAW